VADEKNPTPPRESSVDLRLKKLNDRLKKKRLEEQRQAAMEAAERVLKHPPRG
jgi:hypothetical protein